MKKLMDISIRDQFTYHPPTTEERKAKHNIINNSALDFALVVDAYVTDPDLKKSAINAIQQARMLANQGITYDDLRSRK